MVASTNIQSMLKGISSEPTDEKDNNFKAVNSCTATTSVIFCILRKTEQIPPSLSNKKLSFINSKSKKEGNNV